MAAVSKATHKRSRFLDSIAGLKGATSLAQASPVKKSVSIANKPPDESAGDTAGSGGLERVEVWIMEDYDEEMKRLYSKPVGAMEYIEEGGTLADDPMLQTPDIVREKRLERDAKMHKLRQARRIFKLDAGFTTNLAAKATHRDQWEKRYSARLHKRYWRHKDSGFASLQRPYINPDLEDEDDSTEESEVELELEQGGALGSDSDEGRSSRGSASGSHSGTRSDSDADSQSRSQSQSQSRSRGSAGGSRSGTRSGSGSDADSQSRSQSQSQSQSRSRSSYSRSRTATNTTRSVATGSSVTASGRGTSDSGSSSGSPDDQSDADSSSSSEQSAGSDEDRATSHSNTKASSSSSSSPASPPASPMHAEGDTGVWTEKMSQKWGIPYWQNRHTKHVLWHCPSATAPGSPLLAKHAHHARHAHHMHTGPASPGSPGPSPHKPSRYYVTQLYSLQHRAEKKEKRQKRAEAAQWVMKYSLAYDAFYYKNKVSKELSWDDPRPALLHESEVESFLVRRDSLRASMRSEALQLLRPDEGRGRRDTAHTFATHATTATYLDVEPTHGKGSNSPLNSSSSSSSSSEDIGVGVGVGVGGVRNKDWKVKFSSAYGVNYFKHAVTGEIKWEDPRSQR